MNRAFSAKRYFLSLFASCLLFSCDEFVAIDPPRTDLIKTTVFANDATAEAAIVDVYYGMRGGRFAGGSAFSISYCAALSSDEMLHYSTRSLEEFKQFNDNSVVYTNSILTGLWTDLYSTIYKTNSIIEGLSASSELSVNFKKQIEGEAKFIRAFCHFYLVNLWGDIPLVLTTDYRINNSALRTPRNDVYQQIVKDLKDAQNLLTDDYSFSSQERVRANKGVATALLARVYLYDNDWINADIEATKVIDQVSRYSLKSNLTEVFRTNSTEAIFQLWYNQYPIEFSTFLVHPALGGPVYGALSPSFVNSFETGDLRLSKWVLDVPYNGNTFHRVIKYQTFNNPPIDYSTVLRLAEQYLIRAEARVHENALAGAAADVNMIRNRAGLSNTISTTAQGLLDDIMRERRSEFFTEWGHRWFDLKRTGRIDGVLGPIKAGWNSEDSLLPIPEIQIINNPATTQNNPG